MTTEEKLQRFLETCMEDARSRSNKMLDEYRGALDTSFEEHQAELTRQSAMRLEMEADRIVRDINKRLSIEQMNLKRQLGRRQDELKESLFDELMEEINTFKKTPEYLNLLKKQIINALSFAGNEDLIIWFDPEDQDKVPSLSIDSQTIQFKCSDYSFGGGIRAVIPSRHILIDNSFKSRLDEAKEAFHFDFDPTHEFSSQAVNIGGASHG